MDAKSRIPKNHARRAALSLSARRLVARRKTRLNTVLHLLLNNGLLPNNVDECEKLFADNKSLDPYQIRKKALDNKPTYELGRVLYHLGPGAVFIWIFPGICFTKMYVQKSRELLYHMLPAAK